jgi:hypothetical protein
MLKFFPNMLSQFVLPIIRKISVLLCILQHGIHSGILKVGKIMHYFYKTVHYFLKSILLLLQVMLSLISYISLFIKFFTLLVLSWKTQTIATDSHCRSFTSFCQPQRCPSQSPDLLHSIFAFFSLFPWGLLLLIQAMSYRPMFGVIFLYIMQAIINYAKASWLNITKMGPEYNSKDNIQFGLVFFG